MIDFAFKIRRVLKWRHALGFRNALWFEIRKTFRPKFIYIRVPGMPRALEIRGQESDLPVFRDVVIGGELDIDFGFEPGIIIDCGANVGVTTAVFANRFPNAQVVAVEPSSKNLQILRRNVECYSNVRIIPAAVWSHKTLLKIVNPDAEAWAYRCEPADPGDRQAFEAVGVDDILDGLEVKAGVLVKLDIEGAEENLFATTPDWLRRVQAVLVETHGDQAQSLVMAAFDRLEWTVTSSGEKQLFRRRTAQGQNP